MYTKLKEILLAAGIQVDPDTTKPLSFQERVEATHFLHFKGSKIEDYIGNGKFASKEQTIPGDDSDEADDSNDGALNTVHVAAPVEAPVEDPIEAPAQTPVVEEPTPEAPVEAPSEQTPAEGDAPAEGEEGVA